MLRRLYDWAMRLAGDPHAEWWLAGLAFMEASFFPLPPDLLLIPLILARPERAWRYAAIATGASVAGGWLGYAIGALLYATIGEALIHFYGMEAAMASFRQTYAHWGFLIILVKGLTPIPYKLVTIASGILGLNLLVFTLGSVISRSLRFFLEAALFWRFGPTIRPFVERWLVWVTTGFVALVILGFVALRYI